MTFEAKYPGWCENCDSRITPGEVLVRAADKSGRYIHAYCTPPDDDDQPVCPKCWLTSCDCERDR